MSSIPPKNTLLPPPGDDCTIYHPSIPELAQAIGKDRDTSTAKKHQFRNSVRDPGPPCWWPACTRRSHPNRRGLCESHYYRTRKKTLTVHLHSIQDLEWYELLRKLAEMCKAKGLDLKSAVGDLLIQSYRGVR